MNEARERLHTVSNVHERRLPVTCEQAAAIIQSLSSRNDLLWPSEQWPAMQLDDGLEVGSSGGHGAIRYAVSESVPGQRIEFTFLPMREVGTFIGRHFYEVVAATDGVVLRHVLDVKTSLRTWMLWMLVIAPLHDALIEDAFDKAERNLGLENPRPAKWSLRVRILRKLESRRLRSKSNVAS